MKWNHKDPYKQREEIVNYFNQVSNEIADLKIDLYKLRSAGGDPVRAEKLKMRLEKMEKEVKRWKIIMGVE